MVELAALRQLLAERFGEEHQAGAGLGLGVHDREASFPHASVEALKRAGYFAAPIPAEYGGLGVTSVHDVVVASSRLARADASVASFIAAHLTGPTGRVMGIDMTDAQLAKARRLRDALGLRHVTFVEGFIEEPPAEPESVDVIVSNGVVNLAPDKHAVFRSAARALRRGGRLALADIVSSRELIERTRRNVALWAACIAGAVPRDDYLGAIETAGLEIRTVRPNPRYRFLSPRAQQAADKYGVMSVSVLAVKPA